MNIQLVTSTDNLRQFHTDWNALAGDVPFRHTDWLLTWWNHFGATSELFVLVVTDGDDIVGIAPWYRDDAQTIRMLGSGSVCTDYLTLLAQPTREADVARAIADWQIAHTDEWNLAEIEAIPNDDVALNAWVDQLESHQITTHRRPYVNCWRIDLPETWEEYLALNSKSHRKQIRRVWKRHIESGNVVQRRVTSENELPGAMEVLIDLHQRKWTSQGEPGCFACPRFRAFLQEAATRFFVAQKLELSWFEVDERPLAAEFDLLSENTVFCYLSGIDPTSLDYEPARIVNSAVIRRAIENRYKYVDFLRGDEPYKPHFRAEPTACSTLRVVPPKTMPQLKHQAFVAGVALKSWVKTNLLASDTATN